MSAKASFSYAGMTSATTVSRVHIASRVVASLLGGWLFVWGFTALGIMFATAAGLEYPEAVQLLYLFSFVVFLVVFCWAFIADSLVRVWAALAGGGAVMTTLAWMLSRVE
jgi:hypothetical protein